MLTQRIASFNNHTISETVASSKNIPVLIKIIKLNLSFIAIIKLCLLALWFSI